MLNMQFDCNIKYNPSETYLVLYACLFKQIGQIESELLRVQKFFIDKKKSTSTGCHSLCLWTTEFRKHLTVRELCCVICNDKTLDIFLSRNLTEILMCISISEID